MEPEKHTYINPHCLEIKFDFGGSYQDAKRHDVGLFLSEPFRVEHIDEGSHEKLERKRPLSHFQKGLVIVRAKLLLKSQRNALQNSITETLENSKAP